MSEDLLERSLRLLDEVHSSPSRNIHHFTRPERTFQENVLNKTSKLRLRPSDISDCSLTMNADEMARLLSGTPTKSFGNLSGLNDSVLNKTTKASMRLHQSDFMDCSVTLNPGEISRLLDGTPNKSVGFKSVVQGSDRLYRDFLEAVFSDGSSVPGQVFDIIGEFTQNCVNLLSLKYNSDADTNIIDSDINWLENERNTWRLISALYQNRLFSKAEYEEKKEDEQMEVVFSKAMSEKEVVTQFFKEDNATRECQLVVDWLEKIAADQYEAIVAPQLGHFTDKTVAWENTLHQLQNENVCYASSRPFVTNVDPDAPLRQKKPLHDLDMEDEARLMQQVFTEIRCGRLDQAHKLCYHAGQPWRAATLEGWRLHHDPNYNLPPDAEKLPVEGNPQRDIWKLCAWRLSDDARAPVMARAVHGALCGHLQSLITVCKGWEDLLWAYTRVLMDLRVEQEIRSCCYSFKEYVPMPDNYWNHKMNLEEIFSELEASNDSHVSTEALKPERIVQKLLILNRIPELMNKMGEWILNDSCKPQFIRFLAHLVLILRLVGQSHLEHVGHDILKAYVRVLVNQGDPELVAYYVATLPQEDQVTIFADYLVTITDLEDRQYCLKAAEAVELEVEAITQRVVENIRNKKSEQQSNLNLVRETTEDDLFKVSALDWVVFYPQQRAEALWQANALIRSFLASGKRDAARLAFNKIPSDSIELVASQHRIEPGMQGDEIGENNMPLKTAAAIREYLCHKAYLDAQEGFSDWFQHYHNAKPVTPVKPSGTATFTEKVAYDHRMVQYNKELERWKSAVAHQTKCVKAQLYNVLLFPDGGWLLDVETEDKLRQQQMKALRTLCLPEVVLLLHTVLQSSGEYNECMKLADLVVSEQYELYKVYSKQQLAELLTKLSETSLSLLDNKKDPWGYTVSS